MFRHPPMAIYSALRVTLFLGLASLQVPQVCYGQSTAQQEGLPGSETEDERKVLRHAVFFKFKASSAKEDVNRVVEAFRALPLKIKEIRGFQSGENINRGGLNDGLTHCFLLTFDDEEARAGYLPHPDHKAFGTALRPHLDKVFVIDYWGRPQATRVRKELKHAVFFKFKENTSDDDVRAVEDALAGLPSRIDAIKAFEWGKNNSPESHDQGFTHCFMFTFNSEEGLKEYVAHPAHVAAVKPKVEKIRVFDFWVDDVAPSELTK